MDKRIFRDKALFLKSSHLQRQMVSMYWKVRSLTIKKIVILECRFRSCINGKLWIMCMMGPVNLKRREYNWVRIEIETFEAIFRVKVS